MTEIYLTGNSIRGGVRFRFEADGLTLTDLLNNLPNLKIVRTTGAPANTPIAVSEIRTDDALLAVMVGQIPTTTVSDRMAYFTKYTTVPAANQIQISIDTSGMELIVVFFSILTVEQLSRIRKK
jgi:hypothetical protein